MFETSVIHAEVVAEKRVGLLSVSFAAHLMVIAAILAASIRTIDFPTRAPSEYEVPRLTMPVQIPPPLGTPDGGHRQATPVAPAKEKQAAPSTPTAPTTIADRTEPAVPANTATSDTTLPPGGPGSDAPVGEPWGVKDSIGIGGPPSASTASAEPDVPMTITGDVKPPVVTRRVSPPYPRGPLAARMNGSVIVECIIDKNGHVRDAHVLRSTSTLFEQAAIDAVLQWQFSPGSLHGRAVDTIFDLTVSFKVSS
jgi:protein TonB